MPSPQREPLRRLSRTERAALQRIVSSTSERIDHVRRAAALLAVARTGVFIQAAREAGLQSGTTVADLVTRFNHHGLAAVRIARGRGRRPTYTANARAQMVATAQRSPNRRTDGTATWSLNLPWEKLTSGWRTNLPRTKISVLSRLALNSAAAARFAWSW